MRNESMVVIDKKHEIQNFYHKFFFRFVSSVKKGIFHGDRRKIEAKFASNISADGRFNIGPTRAQKLR